MTDDTPTRLYVSIDRSGMTPVPVASFDMHPGAEEWVPKETLDALRDYLDTLPDGPVSAEVVDAICALAHGRKDHRAALAALPAPPEGAQGEGV